MKNSSFFLNKKFFLICFLLVNLFLSSYYIDIWCTPNAVSRALPVLTLLHDRTLKIDRFQQRTGDKSKVGEHYYSDKAPFPTMATIPFYWMIEKLGLTQNTSNTWKKYPIYIWESVTTMDGRDTMFPDMIPLLFLGSLLFGSIPFAIMIFLVLKRVQGAGGSVSPVLLVMMSFYGSFLFVFAGTYFNHIMAAFLFLVGYMFIKERKYFWSGIFIGLSFISEYPVAVVIPLWAIVIWIKEKNFKKIFYYGLGLLPSVVFILVYNFLITGQPYKMLVAYHAFQQFADLKQNYGFRYPSLASLWGLSFGFYMGLIPHIPVLILCAYFLLREMIRKFSLKSMVFDYLFMFSVPFFLVIASFFTWWGGWSYGPRYLVVLGVILLYEGIIVLSEKKIQPLIFLAVTGFGLITTWLAKVTLVYMIPDYSGMNGPAPGESVFQHYIFPAFSKEHFNANNLFTLGFGVPPSMAAYLWIFLFLVIMVVFTLWYSRLYVSRKTVPIRNRLTNTGAIKMKKTHDLVRH